MKISTFLKFAIVAAIVVLSVMNASWIAPKSPGVLKLIAANTADADACETVASAQKSFVDGADFLLIDDRHTDRGCLDGKTAIKQMPIRKFLVSDHSGVVRLVTKPIDPKAMRDWVWDDKYARRCYDAYFKVGWLGIMPQECAHGTIIVPLDGQAKMWGWPNRFMKRMNDAGVKVILTGPAFANGFMQGISSVDQLPSVPRDFTGYLWVEDIHKIGPAIRGG